MANLDITIPLHDAQRRILLDKHRFKVVCCGRQFGKSWMAAAFAIMQSLSNPRSVGWIISPTYRQSGYLFDKVANFCTIHKIPHIRKKSAQEMSIRFTTNDAIINACSGDDPDKLRGQTLDYLIIDEAAIVNDDIWPIHLRPMMMVFRGPVLFISTPRGKNWFYDIYRLGDSDTPDNEWKSFHYTSYDNPYIDHRELKKIQAETDDQTWRQEYMAEFLDSGGNVFNHFACAPLRQTVEDGAVYIAGLDLAKHVDYTVMVVADADTFEIVDMFRFNKIDWEAQVYRIKEYAARYGYPTIHCDSTGVGDPIVERLVSEGLECRGHKFTSSSKQQIIQNLAVMLQREELKIPDLPIVRDEFERYEFEVGASGFRYNAPSGYHDDIVCAIALLAWGLQKSNHYVGAYVEDTAKDQYDNASFHPEMAYDSYDSIFSPDDWDSYDDPSRDHQTILQSL